VLKLDRLKKCLSTVKKRSNFSRIPSLVRTGFQSTPSSGVIQADLPAHRNGLQAEMPCHGYVLRRRIPPDAGGAAKPPSAAADGASVPDANSHAEFWNGYKSQTAFMCDAHGQLSVLRAGSAAVMPRFIPN
jgi:hypothetical protein